MLGSQQAAMGSGAQPEIERVGTGEGQEAATPEEQAIYDQFIENARQTIFEDDGSGIREPILKSLSGDIAPDILAMFEAVDPPLQQTPVEHLAVTAVTLTLYLDASAQDAGKDIPNDVLYAAGAGVVEDLAEAAEAAGIHDFSDDEMEGAWYRAVDMFRTVSPRADPDALGEEFAEIANADAEGRLGDLLPGINEKMGG